MPFQTLQPLQQRPGRIVRPGQQHPRGDQLEQKAGRGRPAHLDQAAVDDVGTTGQRRRAETAGLRMHGLQLVGRPVDQALGDRIRHLLQDDQVAKALEQVGRVAPGVVAGLGDPVDGLVGGGAVTVRQGVAHLVDQGHVGDAEQGDRAGITDPLRPGTGDQLVQHRQRVPRAAAARPDHQREHRRIDGDALGLGELLQVRPEGRGRNQPERVVMGARADGAEHLVRLGGGEDELHIFRRLLDELEQRVEAGRRDHVRLVDHVDLVAAVGRREKRLLPQLTGVVDTTVTGRVDLDHVDRAGAVVGERLAGHADAARLRGGALLTVERAGQDARAGRLAAAAWPGEEIGVVQPAAAQRLRQRFGNVLLTDDLGKRARSVLPVEGESHSCHLLNDRAILRRGCDKNKRHALRSASLEEIRRTPRAPARARLSLLPSGPGEVHRMTPHEGLIDTLPGPRSRAVSTPGSGGPQRGPYSGARRIRLVA